MIPKFHGDINTPFATNDEKYIKTVKYKEKEYNDKIKEQRIKKVEPPKPIMSMQVMDTIMGKKEEPKQNIIYPSMMVPIPNPNNPVGSSYNVPWDFNNYNVPIIKKYNISMQNVDGNIVKAAEIFEDILPPTHLAKNRMTTLSERQILYSYIRSILVKKGDGEEITFKDDKPELINLLSYMKILEINPYHFSRLTNNPYRTMPDNFVMFQSCYPIRLEKQSNYLSCAKDTVGSNIRIYGMTIYDELANKMNSGGLKKKFCDSWREIMFYQFIREEILKKKLCPHFVYLYSYYITKNTGIDFEKIKKLKENYVDKNFEFENNNNEIKKQLFNETVNGMLSMDKNGLILPGQNLASYLDNTSGPENLDHINKQHKIRYRDDKKTIIFDLSNNKLEVDITKRSSQCIVAITEAPNQNIINWSTRSYVIDDGPIRKQLNTGIHDLLTWQSVLFQIVAAFSVMDIKKFTIKDMSWSKNIFIKDLDQATSSPIGYWKYKIGGLNYYVPNMGALVIIDTGYDEIKDGLNYDMLDDSPKIKFKLSGNFFNDNENIITYGGFELDAINETVDEDLKDNFKKLFTSNNFSGEFTNFGGIPPPMEIINLINSIGDENYLNYKNSINISTPAANQADADATVLAAGLDHITIAATRAAARAAIIAGGTGNHATNAARAAIAEGGNQYAIELALVPRVAASNDNIGNAVTTALIIARADNIIQVACRAATIAAANYILNLRPGIPGPADYNVAIGIGMTAASTAITAVNRNIPQPRWDEIIYKNFQMFLHNKIGITVMETEERQLYAAGTQLDTCKRGDLIAVDINNTKYWAIFLYLNDISHQVEILIKDPDTDYYNSIMMNENEVRKLHGTIDQKFKIDNKLILEEELLETYVLSYS